MKSSIPPIKSEIERISEYFDGNDHYEMYWYAATLSDGRAMPVPKHLEELTKQRMSLVGYPVCAIEFRKNGGALFTTQFFQSVDNCSFFRDHVDDFCKNFAESVIRGAVPIDYSRFIY